jgi:hypothetical protein
MMPPAPHCSHRSRAQLAQHRDYLVWLHANPDLWCDAPSQQEDVDDANRPTLVALLTAMTDAGFFAPTTVPDTLQQRAWKVRGLVGELRRRMGPVSHV